MTQKTLPTMNFSTELEEGEDEEEIDMEWKSRDQLDKQLITLSDVPKSRWNTLCNLDIIKVRKGM